jgi:hypothetical protein
VLGQGTSFYGACTPVTWIVKVRPGHWSREKADSRGNVASLAFLLPSFKHIYDVAHFPSRDVTPAAIAGVILSV